MKKLGIVAFCLSLSGLAVCMAAHDAKAEGRKVTRIRMTVDELRTQGIAVRGTTAQPFPNSCRSAGNARLTVSDTLLAHFQAQGFTLESLCLGLSSNMRFDPETGRQLPLAFVPEIRGDSYDQEFRLNLPLCFRNGVSDLECNGRFDTWWGGKLDQRELMNNRQIWSQFDATVRQFIQRNRVSGVIYRAADGGGRNQIQVPSSTIEWVLVSSALPRGYGYALHGPEGDDPEVENVDLRTHRTRRGSALWSD